MESDLNEETIEHLWVKSPMWNCPACLFLNRAIRERCRNCSYDSNCGEFPWYNPLPPYEGLADGK
jgi:hypothetical protein